MLNILYANEAFLVWFECNSFITIQWYSIWEFAAIKYSIWRHIDVTLDTKLRQVKTKIWKPEKKKKY